MPFSSISRNSLQILDQSYRAPGVSPGALAPGRGGNAVPADPSYGCSEDFLRVLPFINVGEVAFPRGYQPQVDGALF